MVELLDTFSCHVSFSLFSPHGGATILSHKNPAKDELGQNMACRRMLFIDCLSFSVLEGSLSQAAFLKVSSKKSI